MGRGNDCPAVQRRMIGQDQEAYIKMTDEDFRVLRDFVNQYCGIYFDEKAKFLLERRLVQQLRLHRIRSFRDYYFFLKYDPRREEELNILAELLTTNETYFFREEYQLKALTEEIIPEVVAQREKTSAALDHVLRIWSAGCSSGEEPYTLAILTRERLQLKNWSTEIFASDISNRVLAQARKGLYRENAFRTTSEGQRQRYFEKVGDEFRVRDEIRRTVTFGHLNLLDQERIRVLKPQDIIMCRNVIIYFDRESRQKVIRSFYEQLRPGGFLLLGHSESLMNISRDFILRHFQNDMVYQKPLVEVS